MTIKTNSGAKFEISRVLTAPNNPAVLAYIKAMKDGKGLARKVLKGLNKGKKSQ